MHNLEMNVTAENQIVMKSLVNRILLNSRSCKQKLNIITQARRTRAELHTTWYRWGTRRTSGARCYKSRRRIKMLGRCTEHRTYKSGAMDRSTF